MSVELKRSLERVGRRFRIVRLWSALAVCWLAWAAVGAGLAYWARSSSPNVADGRLLATFAGLAAVTGLVCAAAAFRSARDRRWIARRIEAKHPELGTGLLAAVEQDGVVSSARLGFLQDAVLRDAVIHGRTHNWEETVPTWALRGTQIAHAAALALLFVVSFALVGQARSREGGRLAIDALAAAARVTVEPGDTEIERGMSLLVVARFAGAVPAETELVVDDGSGSESRLPMTRSLEDPAFAGRFASVEQDLSYRVEFAGQRSETYRATVFEYPTVERIDAHLAFPSYTSLEPKTVEDVRHVTAVEGTELTLFVRLNKDVAEAALVDKAGETVALTPDANGEHVYRATLVLTNPRRLDVRLVDAQGRPNKVPAEVALNVVRNKPAVVKATRPARDVRVSPLEELSFSAELDDDFGVVRQGVSYTLAGEEEREVVIDGPEQAARRVAAAHLLDFESLEAEPDELVTYYFWAEDIGPDGQPRRTSGDMFFAEVRPFEEIFRQGEQPPGGAPQGGQQGGNARQAMQLAELQKEIINATWSLIRREIGAKPTETFAADSKTLLESQQAAIEQAAQLAGELQDQRSKSHLEQATELMNDAVTQLTEAADAGRVAVLKPAIAAEQAAYQALLRLRDREFEVTRGNPGQQGGGGGGGPSQQQLDQLELSNEENRYEERSSARQEELSQEEQQERETRQVLNRLRELARRQEDLNERLKELQSALEAADDAQAREEIERQLKRLREQQQEILRDTDELRERMESEENRERMADAREHVEESREHVRQASEALEEGRLSQALTEGTRAGRQLDELREELRRDSADAFSEEMTEMRDQARQLDETQDELSEQLNAMNEGARRSLRDSDGRQEIRESLAEQQQQLNQLLDRMRQTVQEAEETEPLLAEELFEAVRTADAGAIPDALEAADRLTDFGITDEAAKASRHAGEGLDQLRQDVEQAAESVLGDETDALRRARGELEDLADQIDREIAQSTGRESADGDEPPEGASPSGRGERNDRGEPSAEGEQEGEQRGAPGEQDAQENQEGRQGSPPGEGGAARQDDPQSQQQGSAGENQPGEPRTGQGGQEEGEQDADGSQTPGGQPGQGGSRRDSRNQGQPGRGATGPPPAQAPSNLDRLLEGLDGSPGGPGAPRRPITGEGYREWSDRMRDVEELLDDPDLRAEAARIRDRARGAREEFRRHSKEPDWTKLQDMVAEPIRELSNRVGEELRRRESPDALVPIDRDPVPPAYAEGVRRYYERLGSGR